MKNLKKIFACLLAVAMLASLLLLPCVSAEEPAEYAGTKWVDILDWDTVEGQYGTANGDARIYPEDRTVYMAFWQDTPYQYGLLFEGIQPKFRISGTIKIENVVITGEGDYSAWNGLRIICGRTDFLNYNTISMYRNVGIQVVNHSTVGVGDIIPNPEGFVFGPGKEFSFELIKDGHRLIYMIDGAVIIDHMLAEEEDFFTEDALDNIGFIAINTEYSVKNLKVEVEDTSAPAVEPAVKVIVGDSETAVKPDATSQVALSMDGDKLVVKTEDGATDPWVSIPLDNIDTTKYDSFTIRYSLDGSMAGNNVYLRDTEVNKVYSGTAGTWAPPEMNGKTERTFDLATEYSVLSGKLLTGVRVVAAAAGGTLTIESITFNEKNVTSPETQPGTESETQPGSEPETQPQTGDGIVSLYAAVAVLSMGAAVVFMKKKVF